MMRGERTRPRRLWVAFALVIAASSSSTLAQERDGQHPRLVSVEGTRCATCHQALFQGKPNVHGPTSDDCTNCHEVEITEAGTQVHLIEAEPALCVVCHSDLERAAEYDLKTPHAPVGDSCLGCHDPHATQGERLLLEPVAQLCAGCHDNEDLQDAHGGQITQRVRCTRCHVPHGTDTPHMLRGENLHPPFEDGSCDVCHRAPFAGRVRMVARGQRLCTACHSDLEELAPEGGSRHAALTGTRRRGGCLSCHDPHLSDMRKLLLKAVPWLCGDCHAEIVFAARAETGHPPAGEDCTTCHQPHLAEHPKLLIDAPQDLCVGCHDTDDADLVATHLGAELAALVCTTCHTPHGAGHEKGLAKNVHPVILDGCDLCHTGGSDELLEDGESALCLMCHDEIDTIAREATVPHDALEVARCADCHNPHASAQRSLIKEPAGGECMFCHDDKEAGEHESLHGAIGLIGCEACHEPHGGSRPALLRAEGNALCLDCHSTEALQATDAETPILLAGRFEVSEAVARKIPVLRLSANGERGHPTPQHPVVGSTGSDHTRTVEVTFAEELSCLACHDPHKGRVQLLRWDAGGPAEACLHCHPK